MRPTRWTVHWTLHFCFAKTLHFVRGSIFKSLFFTKQKAQTKLKIDLDFPWCEQRDLLLSSLPINSSLNCLPYGKIASNFSPNSSPFIHLRKQKNKQSQGLSVFSLVRAKGLEPPRSPTRS